MIQNRFQYLEREFVEQFTGSFYLQYFIGLPEYQDLLPFDASTLVLFRKWITTDMLNETREKLERMIYRMCKLYGPLLP